MADIEVKIDLQETELDTLESIGTSVDVSNVSTPVVNNKFVDLSTKNNGANLKSWATGSLSLADGYVGGKDAELVEQGGYNGYVFGAVDSNGKLEVSIELVGRNIDSIVIYGDKTANQFPTKAYLDNDTANYFYSDDLKWAIRFPEAKETHKITFVEWNRPNYNACLTAILVFANSLFLGKEYIKSLSSISQRTDRPNDLVYGVLPNSGVLEILDIDGELKDYVEDGVISNSNVGVNIIANGKQIMSHITVDSNYDVNAKTLRLELGDLLSNWDKTYYNGYSYNNQPQDLYTILQSVLSDVGYENIDEMLDTKIIFGDNKNGTVKEYLSKIVVEYPYIKEGYLRETINKICTIAQLQVIRNSENKIKFVSARPVISDEEFGQMIELDKKSIIGSFDRTVILKNQYDDVELTVAKPSDTLSINSVFYTSKESVDNIFKEANVGYVNTGSQISGDKAHGIARVEAFYTDGSFTTKTKKNLNLVQGSNFRNYNSSSVNKMWSLKYKELSGTTSYSISGVNSGSYLFRQTTQPVDITVTNWGNSNEQEGTLVPPNIQATITGYGSTPDTTINDNSYINVSVNGENVTVNYHILTEIRTYTLTGYESGGLMTGTANRKRATALEVSLYGDVRTISFEDVSATNTSGAKNVASVVGNELLQQGTTFDNTTSIVDVIRENIKSDYSKGIASATTTVVCKDYSNINGEKTKVWLNGDIIHQGDIVSEYHDKNKKWRVVGNEFMKTGVPLDGLTLQEVKSREGYIPYSWEKIVEMAENGTATEKLKLGDFKDVELSSGEIITVMVVGFNHDRLSSDTTTATGITFGMVGVLENKYYVNGVAQNTGGWERTAIREQLANEILPLFPQVLQNGIKSVNKRSNDASYTSMATRVITTSDKLWLFSPVEINNTPADYYKLEGKQYEYWKTIKDGTKAQDRIKLDKDGNPIGWWTRSASFGSGGGFHLFDENGNYSSNSADKYYGICIGFCV